MAEIDVRQTKSGSRYDVRFRVNGRQRKKTHRTRKDAESYRRRVEAEEYRGLVLDPQGGERYFGVYAEKWLETRRTKGKPLAPLTKDGYRKLLRRNVYPSFEKVRLRQIVPETVRQWYHDVESEKGKDQAAKSYRLLHAIMATAVTDELIPRNPCLIRGAGSESADERPMTDATTIYKLASATTPRLRMLVLLAGLGGLRAGELLGLQRRHFDLQGKTIAVEVQAQEVTGMGRILREPKTEAGKRVIPLPSQLVEELRGHLDAFVGQTPDAPLFTRRSGRPLRRADLSNEWRSACQAVGVVPWSPKEHPEGLRLHDLRHHAGTMAGRKADTTTKEIMAFIGHSSAVAAMRYQHSTDERQREIADYFEGVIEDAKTRQASAIVHHDPHSMCHDGAMTTLDSTPQYPNEGEKSCVTRTSSGGGGRNRTAVRGFAGPCLNHSATPPTGR